MKNYINSLSIVMCNAIWCWFITHAETCHRLHQIEKRISAVGEKKCVAVHMCVIK
jgi:hypothetical protein